MNYSDKYRFALISDIHLDREDGGEKTYFIYAEQNLRRALDVIKKLGCDFIVSAGDQITNASGAADEWLTYRSIIDDSGYEGRVFEALGNHETRSAKYNINTLGECIADFIRYTELGKKDVTRPDTRAPYYSFTEPLFGDAFIFMALENGVSTNEIDNFSDAQMAWAESLIEKYTLEKRRIFLIQHANIYGFGSGDNTDDPAYAGAIMTRGENGTEFGNNLRFKRLIESYRDIIWLSGHTHVDLDDNVNYSNNGGRACHMLHVPALCGTTRLSFDSGGSRSLDRTFHNGSSQGYIVDVYGDRTVFRGIDFCGCRIRSEHTYTVYGRL